MYIGQPAAAGAVPGRIVRSGSGRPHPFVGDPGPGAPGTTDDLWFVARIVGYIWSATTQTGGIMAGAAKRFRVQDFVIRFLAIYTLVLGTYNPYGYSYVHWLIDFDAPYFPVKLFVGVSLFLVYRYIYSMTHRALLRGGSLLALLFFVSLGAALYSKDLLPAALSVLVVMIEAAIALWLAAGVSLVLLWQHVSGQVTATPEVH